jgi:hypothetical protein
MIRGIPSGRTGIDTRKSRGDLLGHAGIFTRGHGGDMRSTDNKGLFFAQ